jgi:hypothetical protein
LFALVLAVGCNPLAPTAYELTHGVYLTPSAVHLGLGSAQTFTIRSSEGHLDELRFVGGYVRVFNPERATEEQVPLGRLERPDHRTLIYRAPIAVRDSITLPVTMHIAACAGPIGVYGNCGPALAHITLEP